MMYVKLQPKNKNTNSMVYKHAQDKADIDRDSALM